MAGIHCLVEKGCLVFRVYSVASVVGACKLLMLGLAFSMCHSYLDGQASLVDFWSSELSQVHVYIDLAYSTSGQALQIY